MENIFKGLGLQELLTTMMLDADIILEDEMGIMLRPPGLMTPDACTAADVLETAELLGIQLVFAYYRNRLQLVLPEVEGTWEPTYIQASPPWLGWLRNIWPFGDILPAAWADRAYYAIPTPKGYFPIRCDNQGNLLFVPQESYLGKFVTWLLDTRD